MGPTWVGLAGTSWTKLPIPCYCRPMWQPIETAPEEAAVLVAFRPEDTGGGTTNPGQCVAYMDAYYQPGGAGYYDGCSGWVVADCGETTNLHYSGGGMPTHWMPLPQAPTDGS
jgi:hypothetical protein